MDTTIKTLLLILVSIIAAYLCLNFLPSLARTLRRRVVSNIVFSDNKRQSNLVNSFLNDKHPGKFFVAMIGVGLLRSIKTINHGGDFPDGKQSESFKRFGTPAIRDALDESGEGI